MPYKGEIIIVQSFIKDMTGIELRIEIVKTALEKAEEYRAQERKREKNDI